jgi:acyl carrier protein
MQREIFPSSLKNTHMGLQTVELIMSIEETFNVEFSEDDAGRLGTVGDIHSTVLEVLRASGRTPDGVDVWNKLQAIVVEQLGVRPDEVTSTARIVEDLGAN